MISTTVKTALNHFSRRSNLNLFSKIEESGILANKVRFRMTLSIQVISIGYKFLPQTYNPDTYRYIAIVAYYTTVDTKKYIIII